MITFNPENKKRLTYGEALSPAMEITNEAEAYNYLQAYIAFTENRCKEDNVDTEGKTAEEICKINLGYFAGYYDSETRERVERLFSCAHPVFGSIEANGSPTPQEAFRKGFESVQQKESN